jgi:hypothetical protein
MSSYLDFSESKVILRPARREVNVQGSLRAVHAAQEVLEAEVGAEGVLPRFPYEKTIGAYSDHLTGCFLAGPWARSFSVSPPSRQ